jgi:SAM-dependent methyltransferase
MPQHGGSADLPHQLRTGWPLTRSTARQNDEASWDALYRSGLYHAEPPTPFVVDVMRESATRSLPTGRGLYVGCGNGRNFLPLVAAGLDLVGLDISREALRQVLGYRPELAGTLLHGDLSALPLGERFSVVVGLHVFHHGNGAEARAHLAGAAGVVAPGGLLCIRVNAVGSRPRYGHDVLEADEDGTPRTVRWADGPLDGMVEHLFGAPELAAIVSPCFEPVVELRLSPASASDRFEQWEAIWRRREL